MYTTREKRFFVMNLFNGTQYQEPGSQGKSQKQKYPFIRTNFKSWTKVWDMKEFEMVRTGEDRFSGQRSMLSMNELRANMDSLKMKMADGGKTAVDDILVNLKRKVEPPKVTTSAAAKVVTKPDKPNLKSLKTGRKEAVVQQNMETKDAIYLPKQALTKPLNQYKSLIETFRPQDRDNLTASAKTQANVGKSIVETRLSQIESRRKEWVKTGYELYIKYSFALVCFVFLFIGAPMGAIISKGGFGYPILVSITFFVAFIFLTILCRKLAESYVMTPFWAAMMPCVVLMPIGLFLTRKAMNDSQMLSTQRLDRLIFLFRKRFLKDTNLSTPA